MKPHSLLGQILGTILVGAIDAGVIATNPAGLITNPGELADVINGFLGIWKPPVQAVQLTRP